MTIPMGYEDDGATGLLTLTGEVDIATAPDFEEAIAHVCGLRHEVVVIDVTQVGFIDSSGLGLVARILKHQRQHGGRVVVRGAQLAVVRIFQISAMDKVVEVEPAG